MNTMLGGLVLAVILLFGSVTCGAYETTLKPADMAPFAQLSGQLGQLQLDIISSARGATGHSFVCLIDIHDEVEKTHDLIGVIHTLGIISSEMQAEGDERIVNFWLSSKIYDTKDMLGPQKKGVNHAVGMCSGDRLVFMRKQARL